MSIRTSIEYIGSYILISLLLWVSARYAYRVNSQLPDDNPKKKIYDPAAINLVLITWPVLLVGYLFSFAGLAVLFVIKAMLYGLFLILFTLALMFIRKPFLLIWLEKAARKIGEKLLAANTFLLRIIRFPWKQGPQPI
jgi:hypothetical protein